MADVIVALIVLAAIVTAFGYIKREKKKGSVCIGCPNGSKCGGNCHSGATKS